VKPLFDQQTWESFIRIGELDGVDTLAKPVEDLVLKIEKTLTVDGDLACLRQLARLKAELTDDTTDSVLIQVVDVYELIIRHVKKWEVLHLNQVTEMYYLQIFYQIISILLRDTKLVPIIGEKASKVTKVTRQLQGKFLGGHHKTNVYGRKIDLLLSFADVELCANEWKAASSESTLIRQQSKNIRVNKCLLDDMKKVLTNSDVDAEDSYLLCMDWNEFNGYMYIIKNIGDITVNISTYSLVLLGVDAQKPTLFSWLLLYNSS
jgi:hypothetical protein